MIRKHGLTRTGGSPFFICFMENSEYILFLQAEDVVRTGGRMAMTALKQQKKRIREEIRRLRDTMQREEREKADCRIREYLLTLPQYRSAKVVFCYVSAGHEIDTHPFLLRVLQDGKRLAVPLCTGRGIMEARQILSLDQLKAGSYGLPEPESDTPLILPGEIDLAVVPCVACSHTGKRLGHGGGYYDRYLRTGHAIPAVVLCREAEVREDIPMEAHDVIFDRVITENGVFSRC